MSLVPDSALQSILFRDITGEAIGNIFSSCPVRHLQDQEVLLTPGQANRTLYLLINGRLQVLLAKAISLPP